MRDIERRIWPFSRSIYCLLKLHHEWSEWKDGYQEGIIKEGKQGEMAEVC